MGRYPGDVYDGDNDQSGIDHPWAICTCNFAELYYRLANEITAADAIPLDANSTEFFNQVGVTTSKRGRGCNGAAGRRRQMLKAIVFHSDNLELSGQFDANTGYEKSVSNLPGRLRIVPVGGTFQVARIMKIPIYVLVNDRRTVVLGHCGHHRGPAKIRTKPAAG